MLPQDGAELVLPDEEPIASENKPRLRLTATGPFDTAEPEG